DCVCSIGTDEDKILVPKPPKNCARCTRCGYLVDGPNCQGCALLRQKLEENPVTYSPDFQNSSELSNACTNVVNAPREPYDARIGYNCPSKVPVISNPEPCNNQTIDELPQTLPIFHPTFHSEAESPFTLDSTPTYVDDSSKVFNPPPQPFVYPCEYCGNDAYYGHYCTPQAPFIYPEPCYNQDFNFPQDFQTVPQQYPCCDDCGSLVIHQPPQEISIQEIEDLKQQYFDEMKRLINSEYRDEIKIAELKENFNGMSIEIRKKEKLLQEEKWAYLSTHPSKRLTSFCFDDDDDEDYTSTITPDEPVLSIEEPDNSLSMGDEHLDTIPATESDEFIKSRVENLIPILSKSEAIPKHVCDVPSHDNSPPLDVSKYQFEDFSESNEEFSSTDDDSFSIDEIDYVEASPLDSELVISEVMEIVIPEVGGIKASNDNPILFYDPVISGTPPNLTPSGESDFFLEVDAFLAVEDEPTSSQSLKSYLDSEGDMLLFEAFLNDDHSSDFKTNDDQSCSNEDVLEKIILKPLSEEEIIPMKSLRTHDSSLSISSKIDSLLDEFAGELTLLESILPGIDETDCDFEKDIRLIEKFLYDNSSPRPLEEFVSANSDAKIKSFSSSPILVKDSDSLMEEIDLFCTPDYPMPPGIVDQDYDSERDILIPKDLPSNNTLSFAEKESFHFDIPSFSRPPAKPPDGDTGILNIKMMGDIYDQIAFMHKHMITLAPHQEKSPDLLSHRCGTVKKFNIHLAPIQSTKEPKHLLSMGYEHPSITLETESDEVTESNAENLLPILSKCEVTLEDEIECDMSAKDDCSPVFTTFSNPLFKDNDDLDSSDNESLPDEDVPTEEFKIYSNPLFDEDEINSDKLDPNCFNVESDFVESLLNRDTFIDFSSKFDFSGEADLFLSDNSIPPGIENVADDPEGDVRFLEELLINDSILSHESYDSNFEDNLSIPRPPPEPPDVESFFDLKPDVIAEEILDKLNEDKCFDPGREINVSIKIEDDDYFPFMFFIRFFLPYFIFPEVSPLLLSAKSDDTIFDPGISD
nr:hypothetical protein [Tanacetum cinerariifolium]